MGGVSKEESVILLFISPTPTDNINPAKISHQNNIVYLMCARIFFLLSLIIM